MLKGYNKQFGNKGEKIASQYLVKQGYKIIDCNFRTRNGEIDIVAIDRTQLPYVVVFVEVKTRTSTIFGDPLEAISYYKLQVLRRTAQLYAASHPQLPQLQRIDGVAIMLDYNGNLIDLRHIKNIQ